MTQIKWTANLDFWTPGGMIEIITFQRGVAPASGTLLIGCYEQHRRLAAPSKLLVRANTADQRHALIGCQLPTPQANGVLLIDCYANTAGRLCLFRLGARIRNVLPLVSRTLPF